MVTEVSSQSEMVDLQDTMFHYNAPTNAIADAFLTLAKRDTITDMTQMKLNKLMYLAQAQYLAATNHRLFNERMEAYKHGPVVPSLRSRFSDYKDQALTETPFDDQILERMPQDMSSFIEQVWNKYKHSSASQLRDMTHHDPAWKSVYQPEDKHIAMNDQQIAQTVINGSWQGRISNSNVVVVDMDMLNSIDWKQRADDALHRMESLDV